MKRKQEAPGDLAGRKRKAPGRNRGPVPMIIVTIVLLIGIALLMYPAAADYVNSLNYKKDIEDYTREVNEMEDSGRKGALEAAYAYNNSLLARSSGIGQLGAEQKKEYYSLINPSGSGMMGYVEIKKVGIYLPIYHGTKESVLQTGVGHVEGSSLPVGGTGTHVILSGHTGLPSSKLFSNIDRLDEGDTFELHVLGKVLTYRVESLVVVLPKEAEKQKIDPERDICTLMTCTPYGINSHRLLVTGARIETQQDSRPDGTEIADESIPVPVPPVLWIAGAGFAAALFAMAAYALRKKRRTPWPYGGDDDGTKE